MLDEKRFAIYRNCSASGECLRIETSLEGTLVEHISDPHLHHPIHTEFSRVDGDLSTSTLVSVYVGHKPAHDLFLPSEETNGNLIITTNSAFGDMFL